MNKKYEVYLFGFRCDIFGMDKKEDLLDMIDRIKERFLQPEVKDERFESIENFLSKPVFLLKSVDNVASLPLDEIFKVRTI